MSDVSWPFKTFNHASHIKLNIIQVRQAFEVIRFVFKIANTKIKK